MKRWKKIIIGFLLMFIVIQFVRPVRNKSNQVLQTDIINLYSLPDSVLSILKKSCYDCHSNNTNYPWYSNIQPFGLWLNRHIRKGKEDLNFSDFGSYKGKRRVNKLKAIVNSINDGTMPLKSYKIMHSEARSTKADKTAVITWVNKIKDSIEQKK